MYVYVSSQGSYPVFLFGRKINHRASFKKNRVTRKKSLFNRIIIFNTEPESLLT